MNIRDFEEKEYNILLDMILLHKQFPNKFTKEQINFFSYSWWDYAGTKSISNGYKGISKSALEKVNKYGLNCKDWKHYDDWYKNNDIIKGIKLIAAGNSYSPQKKLFHSEHNLPCSQINKELMEASNINDIKEILSKSKVYIITSEENELLTKKGWSKKRPENAYEILGIEIINYWNN